MRAWVFTEDKLEPVLRNWMESHGQMVGTDDLDMIAGGIREFLISDQALKLRVRECEPVATPPPRPAVLPQPDPNQARLGL